MDFGRKEGHYLPKLLRRWWGKEEEDSFSFTELCVSEMNERNKSSHHPM